MKLISLEIKGFGSFAKTEFIDFEKMHGLWLISGDTGSGKTTIFDAITFALYGETSDSDRMRNNSSKGLRSDYLADDEESRVTLAFEVNGTRWTVVRTPRWQKQSRKTDIAETASLTSASVSIDKPTEVNKRISELVGVTLDQFRQLAMIAQNDFEKLVTESSKDRQELLRKLLSTDNYARFEERVRNRQNESKKERDFKLSALTAAAADFVWDEASKATEAVNMYIERRSAKNADCAVGDSLIAEMKAVTERAEAEYEAAKADEKQADDNRMALAAKLEGEKALHERFEKLRKLEAEAAKNRAEEPVWTVKAEKLARRQQAFNVKLVFADAERTKKEAGVAEYRLKQAEAELSQAEKAYEAAAEAYRQVPALREKANALNAEIKLASEKMGMFEELKKREKAYAAAKAAFDAACTKRVTFENGVSKCKAMLDEAKKKASGIEELTAKHIELENRIGKCLERITVLEKLSREEEAYIRSAEEEKKLLAYSEMAHKAYDMAHRAYTGSCAQMLASELKDDCPCPVCGSTSHPAPFVFGGEAVDRKTVDARLEESNKALAALEKCRTARSEKLNNLKGRKVELGLSEDAVITEALEQEKKAYSGLTAELKPVAEALKAAKAGRLEADNLEERLKNGEAQLEAARSDETETGRKLAAEEGALNTHKSAMPDMAEAELAKRINEMDSERKAAETETQNLEKNHDSAVKRLEAAKTAAGNMRDAMEKAKSGREEAEKALAAALVENGLQEDEALELMPASQDELNRENASIIHWKETAANTEKNLAECAESLKGKADADPAERAKEVETAKIKAEALKKRNEGLLSAINENKGVLKRTVIAMEDWQKASSTYSFYTELNTVITGGRGKNENLETWLQRMYFARVIDQANVRFTRLTGGMFRLELSEEGLDLNVYDASTCKVRPVNGLSGGEKFKAALSLALGMSEMIRAEVRNIELGMLFIDEGFGTLDADSIAQAINILEDLSGDQGRLVAVISHRQEMRQSISQKILVRKHKDSGAKRGSYITWNPVGID